MSSLHRQVFFIGGFDPKTPRHYHRLYRSAARQRPATEAGESVTVGPKVVDDALSEHWRVRWQTPAGPPLDSQYTVLRWDDIVRRHWPRNALGVLRDYWHFYLQPGIPSGLLRIHAVAPNAFWLAVLPGLLLLGTGLVSLGVAAVLHRVSSLSPVWVALSSGLLWLAAWRGLEARLNSEWLLRLYSFTVSQSLVQIPGLEQRIDELAQRLVQCAAETSAQELMVVAHSTGSLLGSSVLARAVRLAPWLGTRGPQLSYITLGHCTPILAWMKGGQSFSRDLETLAHHTPLVWWDYSAPADWAAFHGTPPWLNAGTARLHHTSPRFHRIMQPAHYRALLAGDRQALHMQYLKAPDLAGGYDPVRLTAGPHTLAEQHAALLAGQAARAPTEARSGQGNSPEMPHPTDTAGPASGSAA
jgi:hypothetical protein